MWAVLPEDRAAELAARSASHDPEQPQLPSVISRCPLKHVPIPLSSERCQICH